MAPNTAPYANSEVWKKTHVSVLIGTRPEAIKLAPVIQALQKDDRCTPKVFLSGQHTHMCTNALKSFDITDATPITDEVPADYSLSGQASHYLNHLGRVLAGQKTDILLVHGDTTTGFIGALAAYYNQIPIGHVEAGLRSHDLFNPYPEEANRRLIAPLASLLFAPTPLSQKNLLQENIAAEKIFVTGNTVVDAVQQLALKAPAIDTIPNYAKIAGKYKRLILVTCHRRENWGFPMYDICKAVLQIIDQYQDVAVVLPVHPNPKVKEVVESVLINHPRVLLTPPLSYGQLIRVLEKAHLTLTDSGGIQEEAPSLETPVLILRSVTERPEAVESGVAKLVGTDRQTIFSATQALLSDSALYSQMASCENPFGDGQASKRITDIIVSWSQKRKDQ
ncbi:non-hydrolyzing UDP-N-acetylglucosamine 2-epimerase [Desulfogranum japonicum]|uniref:non-hydrolyzing UDP-N-acetylglucosamine 2-epimerase n=1 Tax=Desulfogranum japonicum TaxID=231447 RepID=UPI0003FBB54E|nr:UDP-N-acetylglucosamine 2-epimerase (non-hydrolyzing) [Desulfogranum japonicum]